MSEEKHADPSMSWLTFFFVCFIMTMSIGAVAIATYNCNAPEPTPAASHGH